MRIVTYNLGAAADPRAVAAVLRHLRPDVVCAIEAPSRLVLRRICREAGLELATRCGGRRTATAVLTGPQARVLTTDGIDLRCEGGLPQRHVAQAIVATEGSRLTCLAAQLGMEQDERRIHSEEVLGIASSVDTPAVIGVDMNEGPTGPAAQLLTGAFTDAFAARGEGEGATFPNPDPHLRRDYVLVGRMLTVDRAMVGGDPPAPAASHHRPVIADITLDGTRVA